MRCVNAHFSRWDKVDSTCERDRDGESSHALVDERHRRHRRPSISRSFQVSVLTITTNIGILNHLLYELNPVSHNVLETEHYELIKLEFDLSGNFNFNPFPY